VSGAKRRAFHEKLLEDLKGKSFKRLAQLPESEEVSAPPAIRDWKFTVRRRQVEPDVLELQVEARKDLPDGESMSYVKGFRISTDGKIREDKVEIDD
jgi:hypothetical protein